MTNNTTDAKNKPCIYFLHSQNVFNCEINAMAKYKKKMKIVMFEHHTNGKYESEQKILST